MNTKDICSLLYPYYKAHGFVKRRNSKSPFFYKIQNNIVQCCYFDAGYLLYLGFNIWPLYMPTESNVLNYGTRLQYLQGSKVEPIVLAETEDCSEWLENVKSISEEYVFPVFEETNSPEKLIKVLDIIKDLDADNLDRYGFIGKEYFYYKLRAYTNFYLSDFERMKDDIEKAFIEMPTNMFPELRAKWCEELEKLVEMSKASEEERKQFIEDTINHTANTAYRNIKWADNK